MYSLLEAANKDSPTAPAKGLSPVPRAALLAGFDGGGGNSITAGCFLGAAAAAATTTTSSTGTIPPLVLLTVTGNDTAVPVATATSGDELVGNRQARLGVVGSNPRERAHPGIGQMAAEPHRNKTKGAPQRPLASRKTNNAGSRDHQQHQPVLEVHGSGNHMKWIVSRIEQLDYTI